MKIDIIDIKKADEALKKHKLVNENGEYNKVYRGAVSSFGAAVIYSGLDAAVKSYSRKQTGSSADMQRILDVMAEILGCDCKDLSTKQLRDVERAMAAIKYALKFYKAVECEKGANNNGGESKGKHVKEKEEREIFNGTKWKNVEGFLANEEIANLGWYFYKRYYNKDVEDDVKVCVERYKGWKFKESIHTMQYVRMNNSIKAYKLKSDCCSDYVHCTFKGQPGYFDFKLSTTYPGALLGAGLLHGVGDEGEIKIGFQFDHTSGLPYIPGSSVKGIIRSMFSHPEYIRDILGIQIEDADYRNLEKQLFDEGRIIFFDALPVLPEGIEGQNIIGDDFITPHKDPLKNPIPIQFLKVLPDVTFRFSFLKKENVLPVGKNVKLGELFKRILMDTGVGAKTNVGYGRLVEAGRK